MTTTLNRVICKLQMKVYLNDILDNKSRQAVFEKTKTRKDLYQYLNCMFAST